MTSPRLLSLTAFFCCSVFAQQIISHEIASADGLRRVPKHNIAYFAPGDATVTVQLTGFDDPAGTSFAGTRLVAIDSSGDSRVFAANDTGVVVIDEVKEGVYALLASSESAHGAVLMLMQANDQPAKKVAEDLFDLDFSPEPERHIVQMTMMTAGADQIVPIVKNNLPETLDASVVLVEDVYVSQAKPLDGPGFDIKLGRGGALRGDLRSVIRPSNIFSAVSGTNVVVFKNGKPVGVTQANALGQFQLNGLMPGPHGVMIAGRGGYAAFSINAIAGESEKKVSESDGNSRYTYTSVHFTGDIFQVALVPPPMLPSVVKEILDFYPEPTAPVEPTESELQDSETPERIEMAAIEESGSSNEPDQPSATLVADQETDAKSFQRVMSVPAVKMKDVRSIPVNPLRQKRSRRVAPANPLRP